ncbi:hypothetical protein [Bradyrhizobium sp. USDA 3458]|uniref:hypothetical protein n=1 Tax=Bradyrhizobium sp. USDA 3458 TaxID=2591461 RepID=UPI001144BF92|nr:hypothetical protein [Bradyrhizobium sp. USDA 3458]
MNVFNKIIWIMPLKGWPNLNQAGLVSADDQPSMAGRAARVAFERTHLWHSCSTCKRADKI